jgi:GNAT superfamily N-acetyltransferase
MVELAAEMRATTGGQRGARQAAAQGWDGPLTAHLGRWVGGASGSERRALVASVDSVVCAFALAHTEPWDGGTTRGVLDACVVTPDARRRGIGRRLLDGCLEWMGERGCDGVDGVALPGDRATKNFYEASGFKARLLTMHRPLD